MARLSRCGRVRPVGPGYGLCAQFTDNPGQAKAMAMLMMTGSTAHSAGTGSGTPERTAGVILVVDDDPEILALLDRYLSAHNFAVVTAGSGAQLREALARQRPDLMLLDLGLPDEDGLSLLNHIRTRWSGPVIVISGRGETVERVVGLELGADDYVSKPFDFRELLARIRSVLRRAAAAPPATDPKSRMLRFDRFELDLGRRQLRTRDGAEVTMTSGEFALLLALLEQPNRVLSRDQLMDALHGRGAGPFDRTIDVAIARLRRKIEQDPATPKLIQSVRGTGYVLATDVERQ